MEWKSVPTKATAENGMKAALMGEFHVPFPERDREGNEHIRKVNVPWTVIKEIYAAAVDIAPPAPERNNAAAYAELIKAVDELIQWHDGTEPSNTKEGRRLMQNLRAAADKVKS